MSQQFELRLQFLQTNDEARERLIRAFCMMLDFYGLKLIDGKGKYTVKRAENWPERSAHLNRLAFFSIGRNCFHYIVCSSRNPAEGVAMRQM
jgi:hypothetical protein